MKKSYLMLGLVAAALSSCSNDDPVSVNPNENQLPGTENLEPIRLSMSTTSADVEVGTRGTGTVGGTNTNEKSWQYEDIYLLMTSNDVRCLEDGDIDATAGTGWGFTSAMGVGPFLKHQFDGSFWARPASLSTNNNNVNPNVWELNYKIDQNEWWYGAGIDKFYPMKGTSQFSAFYIDDALNSDVPENIADLNGVEGRTNSHNFAKITKNGNAMTVNFKIDGSQDLMAGYAKLPSENGTHAAPNLADQDGGFSAQSARAGIVPQITMNHLLTRFTFEVKKGDDNFDKVTLDGLSIKSKSTGSLTVAAADKAQIGTIAWNETELGQYVDFYLKEKAGAAYEVANAGNDDQCVDKDGNPITISSTTASLTNEIVYYTAADGLHYLAGGVPTAVPGDATYSSALVCTNYSLENGKAALVNFASLPLNTLALLNGDKAGVGEALFVSPGETVYTLNVSMTYLVREEAVFTPGSLEADALATAKAAWEANPEDETLKKAYWNAGGALTEQINQKLDLTLTDASAFQAGTSYNVLVTIYGLKDIVADVELVQWNEHNEDIEVGQDDEVVTTP